ncbi:hypothetical protein [Paracoccus sp. MC1862]|uniref:hypothetical protein n=1 Tax=Paracoccus sp. MC1862 TaxID=2760307 RepID=UPI0016020A48|nr:hypothetical protein [Paracoccus sp. MC1862]MBB1498467.1 hypothetical protein [Paracoccus sp. MC1862]QQO43819.1 hypothetical protein JGR78_10295 [Paracoccus sp. MC1862]
MLYSTSGSRLFIANAPVEESGTFPASGWVQIGEIEALGMLGVEWDVDSGNPVGEWDSNGMPVEYSLKTGMRRPEMPLVMGNDPTDAGQLLLWTAARSQASYPFRLVFPDGTTTRAWFALVIRIGEVFDTANSVMKLQVDLKPTSDISRNGVILT